MLKFSSLSFIAEVFTEMSGAMRGSYSHFAGTISSTG